LPKLLVDPRAPSTLATLPVALLFVLFQRYFVEGIILSGMKE
jgi:ABC-type glycerol-3-phosphate transport system permease component